VTTANCGGGNGHPPVTAVMCGWRSHAGRAATTHKSSSSSWECTDVASVAGQQSHRPHNYSTARQHLHTHRSFITTLQ